VKVLPKLDFQHSLVEISSHSRLGHFKVPGQVEGWSMVVLPAAFQVPLLQPAVKHEKVARLQVSQGTLGGGRITVGERLKLRVKVDVLGGHCLSSGFGEVASQHLAISPDHVAVGVNAHPLPVGDANKLERAILEERTLDATAPGVDANTQKYDT